METTPNRKSISYILSNTRKLFEDNNIESSLVELRKVYHHLLIWKVYDHKLWDRVLYRKNNSLSNIAMRKDYRPAIDELICALDSRKEEAMKEDIRLYRYMQMICNKGAHEMIADKDLKKIKISIDFLIKRAAYELAIFLAKHPTAKFIDDLPNRSTIKHGAINDHAIYGCDIGNANGYISFLNNEFQKPIPMLPNKKGISQTGMPTKAFVKPPYGDEIIVYNEGKSLSKEYLAYPENMIDAIKTKFNQDTIHVKGIEKEINVYDLYAHGFKDLVQLGNMKRVSRNEKPIYDVVFAYPAAFENHYDIVKKMQDSIEKLRVDNHPLRVVGKLAEPAAIAIDYLYTTNVMNDTSKYHDKQELNTIVYDLGHGSFDLSLVHSKPNYQYELVHCDGIYNVGGKNFNEVLYDYVCSRLYNEYQYQPANAVEKNELMNSIIELKHRLSNEESSRIQILLPTGEYADLLVAREAFEHISKPLLQQTLDCVNQMLDLSNDENTLIDVLVLSGGASMMPMVKKAISQLLKDKDMDIDIEIHEPICAVSYGASRYALGIKEKGSNNQRKTTTQTNKDHVLTKKTEYNYGIWYATNENPKGLIYYMLDQGQKLPAQSKEVKIRFQSHKGVIKLYHSNSKKKDHLSYAVSDATNIMNLCFDVKENEEYQLQFVLLEDLNMQIILRDSNGKKMVKTLDDKA